MRRTICGLMAMALLCATAHADPARAVVVDYTYVAAPSLLAYRANGRTFDVTVKNAGTVVNLTGYTPAMWYAASNTASSVITASCAVVTATAGTFRATFSAAAMNSAPGTYVYGIGLTSGTYSTARQGVLTIVGDPYASGATPLATSSSNVNISAYSWTGAFPSSAMTETDTLATVLARGRNAAGGSITNADKYVTARGGGVFDLVGYTWFGQPDAPTVYANAGFQNGSLHFGLGVAGDGATYDADGDYIFWDRTGAGKVLFFDGATTWSFGGTRATNLASVAVGSAGNILVITGYTSFSNLVQSIINAQP